MEQQTKEQRAQALRRQIGTALGKLDAQEIGAVLALIGYIKLDEGGYFPFPTQLFPMAAPPSDLRSP